MIITSIYLDGSEKKLPEDQTEAYAFIFEDICLYDIELLDNDRYACVAPLLLEDKPESKKEALRNFAKEYQRAQAELSTSYEELAFWSGFFETYGEELGLSEEFKENGII